MRMMMIRHKHSHLVSLLAFFRLCELFNLRRATLFNKLIKSGLILGTLVMSAQAQALEQKIGILQDQLILENSMYGKDTNKKIQAALGNKQTDIAGKEEALQKKRDAFQRDEAAMSEKDRNEKKQELAKMQRELQGLAEQYEMEMQDLHQTELQSFRKIVMEELGNIAKAEKIELVLPQHLTYYYEKGIDLTDKVVEALDKRYKSSPPAKEAKK